MGSLPPGRVPGSYAFGRAVDTLNGIRAELRDPRGPVALGPDVDSRLVATWALVDRLRALADLALNWSWRHPDGTHPHSDDWAHLRSDAGELEAEAREALSRIDAGWTPGPSHDDDPLARARRVKTWLLDLLPDDVQAVGPDGPSAEALEWLAEHFGGKKSGFMSAVNVVLGGPDTSEHRARKVLERAGCLVNGKEGAPGHGVPGQGLHETLGMILSRL